jgi:hypothetical protein
MDASEAAAHPVELPGGVALSRVQLGEAAGTDETVVQREAALGLARAASAGGSVT